MAGGGRERTLSKNTSKFDETIDFIIGAPPVGPRDTNPYGIVGAGNSGPSRQSVIKNGMPIVHIQPGFPSFTAGLDLMSRSNAFSSISDEFTSGGLGLTGKRLSYTQQLRDLGFSLKQPSISGFLTCAFLADAFPTDTFTNEYGENFLQKITNVASEGMSGLSQMFGAKSFTEMIGNATEAGKQMGGMTGTAFSAFGGIQDQLGKLVEKVPENSTFRRILKNVDVLAAGGRIDFPMLWKNSTYAPSYTMTIRLYNPNPSSERATAKFIIGPIAALLLLGLPQSVGAGAYSWPFIHRFYAPGIYDLDPGYIANVTVVKGGDQQQISWRQSMGVVDVRIDFGSVFNSILTNASSSRHRPTLRGYLEAMATDKKDVIGLTDFNRVNNETEQNPAVTAITKNIGSNTKGLTNGEIKDYNKNLSSQRFDQATTQEKSMLDITQVGQVVQARVTKDVKDIANNLIDLIPGGIRISF